MIKFKRKTLTEKLKADADIKYYLSGLNKCLEDLGYGIECIHISEKTDIEFVLEENSCSF